MSHAEALSLTHGVPVSQIAGLLHSNVDILKQRVNRYTYLGLVIAVAALVAATMLVSYLSYGEITLGTLLAVQRSNYALWFMDAVPFGFAIMGQYSGSILAYQAGAMVLDQTSELRAQASALERQVMHEATHDTLTDLPNRVLLFDRLKQAILVAERTRAKVAVLVLDLDRFKEINDTLGHLNGDSLLQQVACRLEGAIEEPSSVARLSADEFAVLLLDVAREDDVAGCARKLQSAFGPPFVLDRLSLEVEASVGAAWYPDHGTDPDSLLQRAEIAMSAAKEAHGGYVPYSDRLDRYDPRRLTLLGDLRQAIAEDRLQLHYQPKIDMRSGRITGAEALLRWPQERGVVSPGEFVPLAERSRLIKPLTSWVMRTALARCAAWRAAGLDLLVALNLSARDLHDPKLPDTYAGLLAAHGVDPAWIQFEITESSIMIDQERALEVLTRIRRMGTRLAIDDFGTGYSSLAYLSRLPVGTLKIDKSFVMGMTENENDAVIVAATIDLGHNLGLTVTAEGVETEREWTLLRERGCDEAQGFYVSEALPADALRDFATGSRWAVASHPAARRQAIAQI